MKKLFFCAIIALFPFFCSAQLLKTMYEDVCYLICKNNTCQVSYGPGVEYYGEINVPSTINYRGETYKVTAIGHLAFAQEKITSIKIAEGVNKIGGSAFSGCENLTEVILPNSITEIEDYSFSECVNLQEIHLPNSIAKIGDYSFEGAGLKKVYCDAIAVPYTGLNAFEDVDLKNVILIVPQEAKEAYKTSPVWGKFKFEE